MIKNINYIFILSFCFSLYSFAVYIPVTNISVKEWIIILLFSGIFETILVFIGNTGTDSNQLSNFFLLLYLMLILSKQIYSMCNYINMYHGRLSGVSTIIIGIGTILICLYLDKGQIRLLSYPMFTMIIIMLLLCFFLNIKKLNVFNIYTNITEYKYSNENLNIFNYVLPMLICLNYLKIKSKKKVVCFIAVQKTALFLITLFSFLCVKGNILYSLSPMQILFQISSTSFIRNYDAFYNFFLFFGYFSSLILVMLAYKFVKIDFNYTKNVDLLLILVFTPILKFIKSYHWLIIELIISVIIFIGREKPYEKD